MVSANCASMARAEKRRFGSTNRIASGSTLLSTPRSFSTTPSMPGRLTLTTRRRPAASARYTCPSEAPENASRSMRSNLSDTGPPRPASIAGRTDSNGAGGTASWSFESSSMYGCGRMSALDESHWPSLMYTGPSSMNASSVLRALRRYLSASTLRPSLRIHCRRSRRSARREGSSLKAT